MLHKVSCYAQSEQENVNKVNENKFSILTRSITYKI